MNFKKIIKRYKELNCPDYVFNPCKLPYDRDKYFVICTERSVGKTTNVLLFGMCANDIDGTELVYIRSNDPMIERRNLLTLFSTIKEFDYIRKITHDHYTDVVYQSKRWYYCNYDENGDLADRAPEPFMTCVSIQSQELYKSTLNLPKGNILIFDEFISKRYPQDEFIDFCQLTRTIIRSRPDPIIFMLANTIDRNNQYFYELEINDIVSSMPLGANAEAVTSGGTCIYVDFFAPEITPQKNLFNSLFYGFKNKKLGSVTGKDWSLNPMPHPNRDDTRYIYAKNYYVKWEDKLIQLEVCRSDTDGLHLICHYSTTPPKKDAIIYSLGLMQDWRYHYKFGHTKADSLIWTLYERKKAFFSDNSVGAVMEKYYQSARDYRRLF